MFNSYNRKCKMSVLSYITCIPKYFTNQTKYFSSTDVAVFTYPLETTLTYLLDNQSRRFYRIYLTNRNKQYIIFIHILRNQTDNDLIINLYRKSTNKNYILSFFYQYNKKSKPAIIIGFCLKPSLFRLRY